MASVCISNCVKYDCLPLRPTYLNLYKWPESDVEFVKMKSNNSGGPHVVPRGVDCFYSRQIYLRSYKFSRKKEGVTEKTLKCLSRIKESVVGAINKSNIKNKVKGKVTYAASLSIFHGLLSCSAKVEVGHHDF